MEPRIGSRRAFSRETRSRMSESAKRRCTPEWRKAISERLRAKLPVDRVREMYEGGATQDEIALAFGVRQKTIWRLMRLEGIPARVAKKRNQFGDANHMWKAGSASYKAMHLRVATIRGKPQRCEVCGTDDPSKTYDWASLTKQYHDVMDYRRMCRTCHWKFDRKIENITKNRKGVSR